ncbi:C40 family peptidase [Aureispira sp. CCB-E]|uniref:C40 family peptidase n=1 Tax=Aureispira sp. CCB-E TaxID=3051121 RepID=UPI0028687DF1|nr:C40 family peptidase [Aureispira sp. CCB-E]WMX14358.1 C40 family peptidase [Aureispira sp. CCB-E]
MRLRGIQFIYDNQGRKISAVVDLRRYEKEFAVFLQELSKKRSGGTTTNTNPVIGDTTDVVGSGGNNSGSTVNARKLKIDALLKTARSYYGVPYRTGGISRSGMDCSGFTQTSFKAIGLNLPRVSRDQALIGQSVAKSQLQPGDLVFFATGTPGRINHVGIVTDTSNPDAIRFIHASSSRGIMETSMGINYWVRAYIKARRVV